MFVFNISNDTFRLRHGLLSSLYSCHFQAAAGILTFHVRDGRAEIDVQYITCGCNQRRNGLNACGFCFRNSSALIAKVYDFYIILANKANNFLFCTHANRAACVVKNGLVHLQWF